MMTKPRHNHWGEQSKLTTGAVPNRHAGFEWTSLSVRITGHIYYRR
jgi:hypothetical protein